MLKIRLSRWWKHKRPFYRVVLTEHTRPVKSWYQDVLGWFDPLNHKSEIDVNKLKEAIAKGALPSERVAKMLFAITKDDLFKKYYKEITRTRAPKKEDK